MMARRNGREKKYWSYNTGERGRNWVRCYEDGKNGKLYLEWQEGDRRRRVLVQTLDRQEAKQSADELSTKIGSLAVMEPAVCVSISYLLTLYGDEVTPIKGESKAEHDRRATRVWRAFFDAQAEPHRRSARRPDTLDRTDWDRFCTWRRAGVIPGWTRGVGNRQVEYDLKFMLAVLNWASGHKLDGRAVLEANPWKSEVRRNQGWEMPKELNPHRPSMTVDIREGLIAHAPNEEFGAMLVLERETKRRNSSIRQLRWSDINFKEETITWRAETDKAGRRGITPLTTPALDVLRTLPRGVGTVPIFAGRNGACRSRHTCQTWLRRAKAGWVAKVPEAEREGLSERLRGVGFHAEKRSGVRDPLFRRLSPGVQEAISGTRYGTLRDVYDEIGPEDIRAELRAVSGGS
jgi:integrase